jgi:hypothetical protein
MATLSFAALALGAIGIVYFAIEERSSLIAHSIGSAATAKPAKNCG